MGELGKSVVDTLRWKKFPVLSDGFVCLVDVMGTDSSIVQAARVSYGEGTKHVSDDRTLIRYLMRHRHTTPFEMVEIKFLVRVPMDCWRQWIRHRTANVNEYSTRYSEAVDSMDKTSPEDWRAQSKTNKQGSSDEGVHWPDDTRVDPRHLSGLSPDNTESPGNWLSYAEEIFHKEARHLYEERLRFGVAREQARKDLPLSTYTEAYWKIDLHNLFHFLSLRMDSHAQKEIRAYADVMGNEIVAKLLPIAWEAFVDYRLEGMHLTKLDITMVAALSGGRSFDESVNGLGYFTDWQDKSHCRERDECRSKMVRLGLM